MNCISFKPRYIRPLDVGPSRYVFGGVFVGVCSVSARLTEKDSLTPAIALFAMSTYRTGTGQIARVNLHKRDTSKATFVLKKALEFKERPARQVITLRFFNPYSFGDTFKVLNRDTQTIVFSGCNDGLTYNVVRVLSKAGLTTREFFKLAFGRPGTAFLQTLTQSAMFAAYPLDLSATVGRAEAVSRQLGYAKVYAKIALNVSLGRFRHFADSEKVKLTAGIHKVRLTLLKLEPFKLTLTRRVKHFLATGKRPDRHAKGVEFPLEDAVIIGNRAVRPKRPFRLFVTSWCYAIQLVGVGYLALNPNCHLRGKRKLLSNLKVGEFMQSELPKRLSVPSYLRSIITRFIRPFKRRQKCGVLFGRSQEFDLGNQLHNDILTHFQRLESL